ncbi:UDP-glycosyltransferase 71A16 [Bienertia sinuspersici]
MATTKLAEAQLVFVPTPGIGHLVSAIHFAKLILEHDNRISIVILIIKFPFNFSTPSSKTSHEITPTPHGSPSPPSHLFPPP